MKTRCVLLEAAAMIGLTLLAGGEVGAAPPAAPTFQELMDPAMFPDPQRGMKVEGVTQPDAETIEVRTTGAIFRLDLSGGSVTGHQRLGHQRPLAVLRTGTPWRGVQVTHSGPGFARLTVRRPALTIRINGDSLLMLQAHRPLPVAVDRRIIAAWHGSFDANHLLADEWGAFGVYCSDRHLPDDFDPYADTIATYPLPRDRVLWLAVCPPKPYDWERSFRDNVVWHWSNVEGYPPDSHLQSWQKLGNIVLLQSEVMLWKDWNLDFVPREGEAEFARVRQTLHDLGMRFIVYTSPFYFLKGTDLEPAAMNSFENFTGFPPGKGTGENMGLFMEAITRVMERYKPDGLYFDGQYMDDPAALYALARATRQLLGEDGILEWHSTWALGPLPCYLPQADAYVDFILRGEGQGGRYADEDYLRYFVSGYNIHNSIGVLCNNGPEVPTAEQARRLLSVNGRYHTIAGWMHNPEVMRVLNEEYKPRLNPRLRREVDRGCNQRQARIREKAAMVQADLARLSEPPQWGEPVLSLDFDQMPAAEQVVSTANPDPFKLADGVLRVRGHGHTYAYLKLPVGRRIEGLVVRLRQGTDEGMSWGAGVMVRNASGRGIRIGVRSDGQLQTDILGEQRTGSHHGTKEPGQWIWLRVRWGKYGGVVEQSNDGQAYTPAWRFTGSDLLLGEVTDLLVGKVPYNGQPQDHVEPGLVGECEIDMVRLYGPS